MLSAKKKLEAIRERYLYSTLDGMGYGDVEEVLADIGKILGVTQEDVQDHQDEFNAMCEEQGTN